MASEIYLPIPSVAMIVLIAGPECSGKSTLARQLATEFEGSLLDEHAVKYLDRISRPYDYNDLGMIAREHFEKLNNLLNEDADRPIFLDTWLINIKIWSLYRYSKYDSWIDQALDYIQIDHCLLLQPNIPWEQNPYRENAEDRDVLFEHYQNELNRLNWAYDEIDQQDYNRFLQSKNYLLQKISQSGT